MLFFNYYEINVFTKMFRKKELQTVNFRLTLIRNYINPL